MRFISFHALQIGKILFTSNSVTLIWKDKGSCTAQKTHWIFRQPARRNKKITCREIKRSPLSFIMVSLIEFIILVLSSKLPRGFKKRICREMYVLP